MHNELALTLALAGVLGPASGAVAKEHSRFVTAQMRGNALENAKRFEWAAAQQSAAIAGARTWLAKSDDELWEMITTQELPRDIHTNKEIGCPRCGDGIVPFGNYPWQVGGEWELKCPNCGEVYPKNDFRAYYRSALDEHGCFRRARGDARLLVNAEHPDPGDPLHKLYVDDGYGLHDEKGNRHRFIAYYNSWVQWARIRGALSSLSVAYTLTSDRRYAHKAAVLLDRIADVYPDMDLAPFQKLGFEHSGRQGRIQGSLWENDMVWAVAQAYDAIYEGIQGDEELARFCSAKARQYALGDKSSTRAICRHIEDHLLVSMLGSYKDGRIDGNIARIRNPAAAAIALDRKGETEEWLDYLFDPGFPGPHYAQGNPVPWVLVEELDRDGMGNLCGGYGLILTRGVRDLATALAAYPDYTEHDIIAEFPKLRQCFLVEPRLMCLNAALPNIGDSGATGHWRPAGSADVFALGYRIYRDPRLATLAWRYAGGDLASLRTSTDIFEKDPDALANEIARVADRDPLTLKSDHLGGYGQAVLQTGTPENGRALWTFYGHNKRHWHADCLSIGLYAHNVDMLPDLGYPEYTGAWPQRIAWTSHTPSHNTLFVNDTRSATGGKLALFAVQPPLRAMEVTSASAYPDLKTYRRAVALVDVSDTESYILDVFRARGGRSHRLSYHGPAQSAQVSGLTLVPQPTGTFAGPGVAFAQLPGEGETIYNTNGFSYLYDVARSGGRVEQPYTVDWRAEDLRGRIAEGKEPHLRLHALTPCDEVALASGDPPQNKPGNPRRLRYLLQSRLGEDVASQFVTVLEPYDRTPFIKGVRRLQVEHNADPNSVAAVAVELASGATDILIACETPTRVEVEGGVRFDGRIGWVRRMGGEVRAMRMAGGTLLQVGDVKLTAPVATYQGKIKGVDISDPHNNRVVLDPPLPLEVSFMGRTIHFQNDLPIDTSYHIAGVKGDAVSTGGITLIRGFQDPKDYTRGYTYITNAGDSYAVPSLAALDR
ncbi:MAG: heparinase II/III family protein [Armatimonadetes bacterium]|nr:heparinase II/III family protein [Armatimonadota bacterium]